MAMPQIAPGVNSQPDEDNSTPLEKAFERFSQTLEAGERVSFAYATLEDVLVNVRSLDQLHHTSSKSRILSSRIEPLLHFLDRYARAIDSMVQIHPCPSALIWGIVRIILEVWARNPCDPATCLN
jgi:hypothetical protein